MHNLVLLVLFSKKVVSESDKANHQFHISCLMAGMCKALLQVRIRGSNFLHHKRQHRNSQNPTSSYVLQLKLSTFLLKVDIHFNFSHARYDDIILVINLVITIEQDLERNENVKILARNQLHNDLPPKPCSIFERCYCLPISSSFQRTCLMFGRREGEGEQQAIAS